MIFIVMYVFFFVENLKVYSVGKVVVKGFVKLNLLCLLMM